MAPDITMQSLISYGHHSRESDRGAAAKPRGREAAPTPTPQHLSKLNVGNFATDVGRYAQLPSAIERSRGRA